MSSFFLEKTALGPLQREREREREMWGRRRRIVFNDDENKFSLNKKYKILHNEIWFIGEILRR